MSDSLTDVLTLNDQISRARLRKEILNLLPEDERRTCIQAGGGIGVQPMALTEHFQLVLTFEADPAKCAKMVMNMNRFPDKVPGLLTLPIALGAKEGWGDFEPIVRGSTRTSEVVPDEEFKVRRGHVRIQTIDSLGCVNVDLIHLSIRGCELAALVGGEKTIKKDHPILFVEIKALGQELGTYDSIINLLDEWGYKQVLDFEHSFVFQYA